MRLATRYEAVALRELVTVKKSVFNQKDLYGRVGLSSCAREAVEMLNSPSSPQLHTSASNFLLSNHNSH